MFPGDCPLILGSMYSFPGNDSFIQGNDAFILWHESGSSLNGSFYLGPAAAGSFIPERFMRGNDSFVFGNDAFILRNSGRLELKHGSLGGSLEVRQDARQEICVGWPIIGI